MFKTMLKDQKGSAQNWILGIAFILIIGIGIYAIAFKSLKLKPSTSSTTKAPTYDPSLHQALSVNDIARHPNVYEGKNVELLRAVARDWVTDRAFTISDIVKSSGFGNTTTQSNISLLVMRKEPFALPEDAPDGVIALGEQSKMVQVAGVVRYFNADTFQKNWGFTFSTADLAVLKKYTGKPVLVLSEVKDYVSTK